MISGPEMPDTTWSRTGSWRTFARDGSGVNVGSASIDSLTSWYQLVLSNTTDWDTRWSVTAAPVATVSAWPEVSVIVDAVTALIL